MRVKYLNGNIISLSNYFNKYPAKLWFLQWTNFILKLLLLFCMTHDDSNWAFEGLPTLS